MKQLELFPECPPNGRWNWYGEAEPQYNQNDYHLYREAELQYHRLRFQEKSLEDQATRIEEQREAFLEKRTK